MQGNKMLSDGSNENDLKAVNIASMQKFTGSHLSDFESLYNLTIKGIDLLIEADKIATQELLKKEDTKKRIEEINEIVSSILETVANLPMDARIRIKNALNTYVKEETIHVKETTSTEEVAENSNKQGTESPRKRGRPSKKLS